MNTVLQVDIVAHSRRANGHKREICEMPLKKTMTKSILHTGMKRKKNYKPGSFLERIKLPRNPD